MPAGPLNTYRTRCLGRPELSIIDQSPWPVWEGSALEGPGESQGTLRAAPSLYQSAAAPDLAPVVLASDLDALPLCLALPLVPSPHRAAHPLPLGLAKPLWFTTSETWG